jgi:hypothetical protein
MTWDHKAVSASGKYIEQLVLYNAEFSMILQVVNNHHDKIIHVKKNCKGMWHRPSEGFLLATEEDFRNFIRLIYEYDKVEIT